MAYRVKLVDVGEQHDTLVQLWRDNLDPLVDPRVKLDWYYQQNPQGGAEAFLLEYAKGRKFNEEAASVVGCVGVGHRRFSVGGHLSTSAVFIDLAVNKKHRTLFPARMLQVAAQKLAHESYDFSYGMPNENAIPLFKHMGYQEVGKMQRYARVLHHAEYVERVVPEALDGAKRLIARAGGALLDRANDMRDVALGVLDLNTRFEWIKADDPRLDELWQRTRSGFGVVGERTASVVGWRFGAAPSEGAEIGALINTKTKHIDAYAAVREEMPAEYDTAGALLPVVRVMDIFGAPARITALLRALCAALRPRELQSISINLLAGPAIIDAITAAGFAHREELLTVVVDPGNNPHADLLCDPAHWLLTEGDMDGG